MHTHAHVTSPNSHFVWYGCVHPCVQNAPLEDFLELASVSYTSALELGMSVSTKSSGGTMKRSKTNVKAMESESAGTTTVVATASGGGMPRARQRAEKKVVVMGAGGGGGKSKVVVVASAQQERQRQHQRERRRSSTSNLNLNLGLSSRSTEAETSSRQKQSLNRAGPRNPQVRKNHLRNRTSHQHVCDARCGLECLSKPLQSLSRGESMSISSCRLLFATRKTDMMMMLSHIHTHTCVGV